MDHDDHYKKSAPKKPTQAFGSMTFGKDGSVKPAFNKLTHVKDSQELEVVERFIDRLNKLGATAPIALRGQLAEADQDFSISVSGAPAELQLTELVDRAFLEAMTADEYDAGKWTNAVVKKHGEAPWRINAEARDQALANSIARKVEKRYATAPGIPLWLLVFSTYPYITETMEDGTLRLSEGLCRARRYMAALDDQPFAEVWFFNLLTNPVKVWPCSTEDMQSSPERPPLSGKRVRSLMVLPTAMKVVTGPRRD